MTCLVWGEGGGGGGCWCGYVVYLIWPGLDHSPHTTVPCNYGVWWSNKQDDLTGQGTCVNTNINSNVGPSTVVEGAGQRTWAAQHTAWSGLVWSGLGWARAQTFSPDWQPRLAQCDGVTVWRCDGVTLPARQIFKWPKFASPTWWVTSPCFVISWAPASPGSFLIYNIYKDIIAWQQDDSDSWWQADDAENPAYYGWIPFV